MGTKCNMMALKNVYHTGPVTALCCHDNAVLAGIGSKLYVYSITDVSNKQIVEVLHGRIIHGIRPETRSSETRLCIYGQKVIRLVKFDPLCFQIDFQTDMITFTDWIWDIEWIKDIPAISLALGHNVVVTFDIERKEVIGTAHCQEKCIVYCAKFITDIEESLVVAAGTVFNQVVIWSPVGKVNEIGRQNVIHRLTGHQGVIFSIDYDPHTQRICSVSDDRSIRLYQVKFPTPTTSPCLKDWEGMDSSLLHLLYGHSARVWDVKLLSSVLVSVGEDSTCCIWSYEGHVIQKLKGHKGKSIWSMSVDQGENFVVTGGGDHSIRLWNLHQQGVGADKQAITTSIPLETPAEDFPRNTLLLDMDRILILTNMGNLLLYNHQTKMTTTLMADTQFASYTVMAVSPGSRSIAVGNIAGCVRIFATSDALWEDVSNVTIEDVSLYQGKLFSVLWLDEGTLLTTGPEGAIGISKDKMFNELTENETFLDPVDVQFREKISQVDHSGNTIKVKVLHDLHLPLSKHRWLSAAAYVQDDSYLVCGDRMGSVYLYCLDGENKNSKPVQVFIKLHGKAGTTSVCCHGNHVYTTGRDGLYRVYSWTELGTLEILNSNRVFKGLEWLEKISFEENDDLHVQGFHANMFVVWSVQRNQKLLEVECGGGHRAWGFCCHGNKAQIVFIKTREVLLKEIDIMSNQTIVKGSLHGRELCDAKHACTVIDKGGRQCEVLVTCSEDTSVCVSSLQYMNGIPKWKILTSLGGHISSVRCLSVCSSSENSQNASSHRKLIFSGGGRAQMNVSRISIDFQTNFTDSSTETDKKCTRTHISHNQIENVHKHSSVRDEGFSVPKKEESLIQQTEHSSKDVHSRVSELTSNHTIEYTTKSNVISTDCDIKCSVEHLAGIQLGQCGKRRKKPWRHFEENSDPETRILDVTVLGSRELNRSYPQWLYFLALACSDGYIRFYAFNEKTREITQLSSSSYHDHCVLKTCHVIHRSNYGTNERLNEHVRDEEASSVVKEGEQTQTDQCSADKNHVTAHIDDVKTSNSHVVHSGTHVTDNQDDVIPVKDDHVIILTAATDGVVAFWDMTEVCDSYVCDMQHGDPQDHRTRVNKGNSSEEHPVTNSTQMSPFFTLSLHQSGINSICFSRQSDGRYILLTGGDDNAVKVSIVSMETSEGHMKVNVISQGGHDSAHSAQITGIWALSPTAVLTASIDQRVCIWSLLEHDSEIKLSLLDCMFVDVMDIANIGVWSHGTKKYVLLSGEGLQVLEVDLNHSSTAH